MKKRLRKLEQIESANQQESVYTMCASQDVLAQEWDNKEDERWNSI